MSGATLAAAMDALGAEDLGTWTAQEVFDFVRWADGFAFENHYGCSPDPVSVRVLWSAIVGGGDIGAPLRLRQGPATPLSPIEQRRRQWQASRPRLAPHVFARDGAACANCGATDAELTIDHIVPIAHGGTDELENLRVLCRSCNCRKGARP